MNSSLEINQLFGIMINIFIGKLYTLFLNVIPEQFVWPLSFLYSSFILNTYSFISLEFSYRDLLII